MSTPRAAPPTADVKQIRLEEKLQRLNVSEVRNLKEGARAASQEAASRAERTRKGLVRDWAFQPLTRKASTAQVEKVPESDPSAPHFVTLVGCTTKPDSEKKDTTAPSAATMKEGLPLNGVDIHEEGMSLTLEEAEFQAIGERARVVFTIHEAPRDARPEGQREELDLDPELRRLLENGARLGENQDADNARLTLARRRR